MNPLLQWLTSPEWTHVVGALLHSLWQGAIVALALAVLMRRLANPVTRYRCALGALGLVFISGLVTWALLNAPKSGAFSANPNLVVESTLAPVATAALNPDFADIIVASGTKVSPPEPKYWIAGLALVWIFGAAIMLLRAGIKVAGAEKLRRSCQPLHDERMVLLVTEARRAVGLVRQIRVAVTDKLTSPAVVGVIVPTLILPLSLFTALTPEQIRFILLHELAHIRRGDYFANLFQLLAEALLFFNPAVWWISHQIRREREACCDALAIELSGAPVDYARTLVRVAESILHPASTAALAFGEGQREPSSLTDRVQRLLVPGYRPALRLTWRAMLASVIGGGTLLVLSAVGTRSTVGAILSSREIAADGVLEHSRSENSDSNNTSRQALETIRSFLTDEQFRTVEITSNSIPRVTVHNDHPFWSLDGDANGYTIATAKNPATPELLSWRNFNVNLNAFYAAVRKSAGLPETMTGTNLRAAIRPFFAKAAGVNLDLQSGRAFIFSDSLGEIKVYATLPELDAIEALLRPLTGPPVITRFFHLAPDFLAKATNGLTAEISSVFVTNPAAGFQTVLESIASSDPRPPWLMYVQERGFVVMRATEADLDKFESTIKPLVDLSSSVPFRTVPVSSSAVDLPTRTFKVGPVELAHALGRDGPVQVTNAAAMVQELMVKAGVDLKPPKTVVFKDSLGLLMVHATKAELDTIEGFLVQANQGSAFGKLSPGNPGEAKAMVRVPKANLAGPVEESSTNLLLRVYTVDAKALAQVLEAVGTDAGPGARSTNDGRTLLPDIRKLFGSLGVDLQPPKTVFYNEPKGQLLVRATQSDFEQIDQVVQVLNEQPSQVNLRAMFVEVPGDGSGDMFLGNLISPPPQSKRNASGKKGVISASAFTGSNVFTGILTEPQFKAVLTALEARKDVKILSRQNVTTLSGRQAQMQTVEIRSIVTGIAHKLDPGR
ncbi:MAG: M56 family metallopeptidase [Verrucomicrobiota bacterium]